MFIPNICFIFEPMNKTLGIITINWKRISVLQLWCAQIKRLREELDMFIPAVVVSEVEGGTICNQYKVHHIIQQNDPATEKFNTAMGYMKTLGMDYVMVLGSDDIISTWFVRKTMTEMARNIDYIGCTVFYFYAGQGIDRGKLVKLDTPQTKGIGRTVSKRILDLCDWRLWDVPKNWGMDAIATKNILKCNPTKAIIEDIIVDVKTRDNLNSFKIWGNRLPQVDSNLFYNILSEEEKSILFAL